MFESLNQGRGDQSRRIKTGQLLQLSHDRYFCCCCCRLVIIALVNTQILEPTDFPLKSNQPTNNIIEINLRTVLSLILNYRSTGLVAATSRMLNQKQQILTVAAFPLVGHIASTDLTQDNADAALMSQHVQWDGEQTITHKPHGCE